MRNLKKPVTDNSLLVATKILGMLTHDSDLLNHRKLHCLMYLEQGYFLGEFGYPLFSEDIEHWFTMPAVPSVFYYFKNKGYEIKSVINAPYWNNSIFENEENSLLLDYKAVLDLTDEEEDFFKQVFNLFNRYTSDGLMELIKEQLPWRTTTCDDEKKKVITKDKMLKYFKKDLNN